MCSLGDFFSERLIIRKENAPEDVLFHSAVEREIGAEDADLLKGVIILDAIFYPLYQYFNIVINTESDKNYSADTPFEHLLKFAKILDIEIPDDSIHQHKENWNPSNIENDFADIVRPNIEVYGNKARSQLKSQILRQKKIHAFLEDISTFLTLIAESRTKEKHIQIKYLFFFYILNKDLNIIRNHLPDSWLIDYDRMSFLSMYLRFLDSDLDKVSEINDYSVRSKTIIRPMIPKYQKKRIINDFVEKFYDHGIKIATDYIAKNMNITLDSALWESIARVDYVSNLLDDKNIMDLINFIAIRFGDEYINDDEKQFWGNLYYIEDLNTVISSYDAENLFSIDQSLDCFVEGRADHENRLHSLERKRRIIGDDIELLTNPFSIFAFSPSCQKCPFRIYKYPIKKLSLELQKIIEDLRKHKGFLENWLKNYSGEGWYADAKEKVNEVLDVADSLERIEYRDFQAISKLHKGRKNTIITDKVDNKKIVPAKIEEEINDVMKIVSNTYDFLSPFLNIICFEDEEVTIDGLFDPKILENIGDYIVTDCNGNLEHNKLKSNEAFPYLSRKSIREWKIYFNYFCSAKDQLIAFPLLHDSPEKKTREDCYTKFLRILRDCFIVNMITELKEFGDVNESSIQ